MSAEAGLNADFLDLLEAFFEAQVEFLVVGAPRADANHDDHSLAEPRSR